MISVTDSMIVQVYKRPQNACLVTLTCLYSIHCVRSLVFECKIHVC